MEDLRIKISQLDTESQHWRGEANKARGKGDTERADTLKKFAKWCELGADEVIIRLDDPVKHDVTKEAIDDAVSENERTKVEEFKRWIKKNRLIVSGVAIMFALLVTSIIAFTKVVIRVVESATNKIAYAFKKIAKLGPVLGPIVSVIGTVLSLAGKAARFVLENLWLKFAGKVLQKKKLKKHFCIV